PHHARSSDAFSHRNTLDPNDDALEPFRMRWKHNRIAEVAGSSAAGMLRRGLISGMRTTAKQRARPRRIQSFTLARAALEAKLPGEGQAELELSYLRRIFSIGFPLASSSMSLSR